MSDSNSFRDHEYEVHARTLNSRAGDAWKDADPEFLRAAKALGIGPAVDIEVERPENMKLFVREDELDAKTHAAPGVFTDTLDTELGMIIDEFGPQHEKLIRGVAERIGTLIEGRVEEDKTKMISMIVCILVHCETSNLRARVHQLLHAIPRLALVNGFPSMKRSAETCGVSREWIRRGRDEWCERLGIQIPAEGRKSGAKVAKLKAAAETLRAKTNDGGIATVQGVKGEFSLWSRRVGGVNGVVGMGRRAASEVLDTLRPMAEFYDGVRRSVVSA
jgi:hypothetical protein